MVTAYDVESIAGLPNGKWKVADGSQRSGKIYNLLVDGSFLGIDRKRGEVTRLFRHEFEYCGLCDDSGNPIT